MRSPCVRFGFSMIGLEVDVWQTEIEFRFVFAIALRWRIKVVGEKNRNLNKIIMFQSHEPHGQKKEEKPATDRWQAITEAFRDFLFRTKSSIDSISNKISIKSKLKCSVGFVVRRHTFKSPATITLFVNCLIDDDDCTGTRCRMHGNFDLLQE